MDDNTYTHLQYGIGYYLVDPTNMFSVPKKIDDGLFRLRAPYDFTIGYNQIRKIKMGIIIDIPDPFLFQIDDKKINAVLHARLSSEYDTLDKKGLMVLGPSVLSAKYMKTELELMVMMVHRGSTRISKGDILAELSFTTSPSIFLGIKAE